jgi:hypothetical protein
MSHLPDDGDHLCLDKHLPFIYHHILILAGKIDLRESDKITYWRVAFPSSSRLSVSTGSAQTPHQTSPGI